MPEGRCNCGSIKVSFPEMPKQSAICYCSNCRRSGSTLGAVVFLLDRAEVTIDDPKNVLKTYTDNDTTSGNPVFRQFCIDCGCPVASLTAMDAPKVIVKAGLFDHMPKPGMAVFTQDKPEWLEIKS